MTIPLDRRTWIVGSVLVAFVLVAASWFLAIHPKLASASSLNAQTDGAQTQNLTLQTKANKLKKLNDNMDALQSQLDDAQAELPSGSGIPDFTRQLNAQAIANGVLLDSMNVGGGTSTTSQSAKGLNGAVAIPITLATEGNAADQYRFLKTIQSIGPRLVLVGATTLSPGSGADAATIDLKTKLTIQLTVFSLPS